MFKKVCIVTANGEGRETTTRALRDVLGFLHAHQVDVVMNDSSSALTDKNKNGVVSFPDPAKCCDLAIAIGGDGTMLQAAKYFSQFNIPLLGVNQGRLGFLADIPADQVLEHLDAIFSGNMTREKRAMLCCEAFRGKKSLVKVNAINDVVIHKWNMARLLELATYIHGELVHIQRSDGFIVATPTGSTAYALSGGGPILTPLIDAFLLVPICPHTLSQRPLVVDGDSVIEVVLWGTAKESAQLTCDGQSLHTLSHLDRVRIKKSKSSIEFVRPKGNSHFHVLRNKLYWGKEPC